MSAAPVEFPHAEDDRPQTLLEAADEITEQLPGHRVEIVSGILTVTPIREVAHARCLTGLMLSFINAGLHGEQTELLQGVGLWLPDGPEDFVIPDLSVVDADIEEHLVEHNCYDPAVFRLVLEVTSSNYNNDLRQKVTAYAMAKVPVYVIVDRRHERVHSLTEPVDNSYDSHRIYAPGEEVQLPSSLGAEVRLDVSTVLNSAAAKGS